jgi:hypothetical protein
MMAEDALHNIGDGDVAVGELQNEITELHHCLQIRLQYCRVVMNPH